MEKNCNDGKSIIDNWNIEECIKIITLKRNIKYSKLPFSSDKNGVIQMGYYTNYSNTIQ